MQLTALIVSVSTRKYALVVRGIFIRFAIRKHACEVVFHDYLSNNFKLNHGIHTFI